MDSLVVGINNDRITQVGSPPLDDRQTLLFLDGVVAFGARERATSVLHYTLRSCRGIELDRNALIAKIELDRNAHRA